MTVSLNGGGSGGGRLLLHDPGGADVTELVDIAAEFAEFYAHPREELLYVAQGTVELELREDGQSTLTRLGPRASIRYSGRVPHRFRRVGAGPCVVVMVHSGT